MGTDVEKRAHLGFDLAPGELCNPLSGSAGDQAPAMVSFTNFRLLESKMGYMRRSTFAFAAAVAAICLAAPAHAEKTLRAVMHSDLKILDPIWTTAYIVRNHGYMIYDTLFATDAKGEIKPQMVDKYDVSKDRLTYTITLRGGRVWRDGRPGTAEDRVASMQRWSWKASLGQQW